MTSYRVSEEAQVLMGLHAAQYAQYSVTGLLVGREVGETIEISHAYPVSHQAPTAPFLEYATTCVDVHATKSKLKIVGVYVANSRADDTILGPVHARIANAIESQSSRACVLLLDNKSLTQSTLYLKDIKKGWMRVDNRLSYDDTDGQVLTRALSTLNTNSISEKKLHVVDFDEHMEQLQHDWRNPQVYSLARLQV